MMNKEEQRIAIAEACGWKDCHESENWAATIGTLHEVNGNQYALLADYLNDLNAMHEAEKILTENQLDYYAEWLKDGNSSGGFPSQLCHWHATAAQRAEAFLKTLNLWKHEQ
jgi:hypothetical protein